VAAATPAVASHNIRGAERAAGGRAARSGVFADLGPGHQVIDSRIGGHDKAVRRRNCRPCSPFVKARHRNAAGQALLSSKVRHRHADPAAHRHRGTATPASSPQLNAAAYMAGLRESAFHWRQRPGTAAAAESLAKTITIHVIITLGSTT
jgi:hypothetical protein